MDRNKALDKIKKCLALSRGGNEHEAATAMRQAQAMMREHEIDEAEVLGVNEHFAKATSAQTPIMWEAHLALRIAAAFNCELIFDSASGFSKHGQWHFIGLDHHPEIATYAFEVLLRQVKRARADYIATGLRRYGRQNKTRMADMFCLGWVRVATQQLSEFEQSEEQYQVIAAFVGRKHPTLGSLTPRNRADGGKNPAKANDAYRDGMTSGKSAQLNQGVAGSSDTPKRLEQL